MAAHPAKSLVVAVALVVGAAASALPASPEIEVASPDGHVRARLSVDDTSRLRLTVTRDRVVVIDAATLSLTIDGQDVTAGVTTGAVETAVTDASYPWRGVHALAIDRARTTRVPVTQTATGSTYAIDLRADSAGAAFRFVVPGEAGRNRVPEEASVFRLPHGSVVWYHDFEGHYEGQHVRRALSDVPAGDWAAPPLTFRLPEGGGYGSITEANVLGYAGMGLQADGRRGFVLRLGHEQPASYPFRLRYAGDVEPYRKPAAVSGTITTPWRVVLTAPDLDGLVNADLVHNLALPPDPVLFADGSAWIRPGRAVWRFLDGGEATLDGQRRFVDLARQLGFEYTLLEGFWQRWTEDELRQFVAYARERRVGVWVWLHSKDLRNRWIRRTAFATLQRIGIVGVKIDFFDHEAKAVMDLYGDMLRDTAEHRLMVNFHGASKPTGESRTWPHELTREGIFGLENRRAPSWARHNATLPFTRLLAGHGDYTPVIFGDRRKETSWAHQIATAAVFTSPLLVYGANPESLVANPASALIAAVPATWDETRVLPQSEIGEVAALARRHGSDWFLAIVNGPDARVLDVPLAFLGPGDHTRQAAEDDPADAARVQTTEGRARRSDTIRVVLRAGGGYLARFSRAGPSPSAAGR
jgi:alpha-glucosidase